MPRWHLLLSRGILGRRGGSPPWSQRICVRGRVRPADIRGEIVEVANSAISAVALSGLEITDYTATQQHVHIYRFPVAEGGGDLGFLAPGCSAYVFTGPGQDTRLADGDLLLFAGYRARSGTTTATSPTCDGWTAASSTT